MAPRADDTQPFLQLPLDGSVRLVRLKASDPQCLVDPASPSKQPACWALSETDAEAYLAAQPSSRARLLLQRRLIRSSRTLTCGAESAALFGSSGYEDAGGWCSVAKDYLNRREQSHSN